MKMGERCDLNRAMLDWMQEFANQGILTTDTELTISSWNQWLETNSGRSADEMVGHNLLEAYPELAQHRLDRFYFDALAGQAAVLAQRFHRYLLPMPTSNDGALMMQQSARIAPLFAGMQVVGTITVIEDVTERVGREEDLRRARDELELRVQQRTAELAGTREQLRHLSHRLIEVQENERRAIARELHDETGQALTTLLLGLHRIELEVGNPAAVMEEIRALKQMTNDVMEGIHRLAMNLRPATLDRLGLIPALIQYIEACQRQSYIAIDLESSGLDGQRVAPEVEVTLYRVIQEAITNIMRHSQAQNVGIVINHERNHIYVVIEDDGIGFDVQASLERGRLGLLGMRERVEMLGGTMTLESGPGTGTAVYLEVPDKVTGTLQTP
jgi:PAS domain S-box-containing protein